MVPYHPSILQYAHEGFRMEHDLDSLLGSRKAGLLEAAVFYAARILEALSRATLDAIGLDMRNNTFANLEEIRAYGMAPSHTLTWAHALRREGNQVRHAHKEMCEDEEEAAYAFLQMWLRWFFCSFEHGLRLPSVTRSASPERSPALFWLNTLIEKVELEDVRATQLLQTLSSDPSLKAKVLAIPSLVSVVAERLLSEGRPHDAERLLLEAENRTPSDLRVLQLIGLCYSRTNRLNEALDHLKPLFKRYRNDSETIGIMGGLYKRMWRETPGDKARLTKCHRTYAAGWHQDPRNTYLGINVATALLFLGQEDAARQAAFKVKRLIAQRLALLQHRRVRTERNPLSLWDRLTLAEAELLLGNAEAAANELEKAYADHPDACGDFAVCVKQLKWILKHLGASFPMKQGLDSLLEQLHSETASRSV